jgi:hypothetical protein
MNNEMKQAIQIAWETLNGIACDIENGETNHVLENIMELIEVLQLAGANNI